jgi:membrane-bound lytic murein transglycosylase F
MAYEELFQRVARDSGVDWRLLAELAWRESRCDPNAVGAAGEKGMMQIMPSTWDEWAPRVGVTDPFDAESSVRLACGYLVWIARQLVAAGRPERYWSLAAYNWGIGNVLALLQNAGGWLDVPRVTREYATGIVLAADARLFGEHLVASASVT